MSNSILKAPTVGYCAANRFLDNLPDEDIWCSLVDGDRLVEPHDEWLNDFCEEYNESFEHAQAEVVAYIRWKIRVLQWQEKMRDLTPEGMGELIKGLTVKLMDLLGDGRYREGVEWGVENAIKEVFLGEK